MAANLHTVHDPERPRRMVRQVKVGNGARAGRAVEGDLSTVEFTEIVESRGKDIRRGLDYLDARTDVDRSRIAGSSALPATTG
jgi:hypothetical protein